MKPLSFSMALCTLAALLPACALAQSVVPEDPRPVPHVSPDQQDRQAAEDEDIPLTPEMIHRLGDRLKANQRAREEVATEVAAPSSRPAIRVSFAPGQQTSLIFTTKGYPTAVSFVDRSGAPWPIAWNTTTTSANPDGLKNCSSEGGKGGSPAVQTTGFYTCVPYAGSNTINIEPLSLAPRGGLLVTLKNAPKPISFLLLAGRGTYDDNLTVRVNEDGPNARQEAAPEAAPGTAEPFMNAMLSGIAPASAVPQSVEGLSPDEVRAWRMGNELYLRTRLALMTPAWDSSERGEDGYTLYAFRQTPYILLSDSGRTVSASLKDMAP
ncbi:type IV secretion protein DotH [Gluconobacter albidus]|uniref:Type IV secretion protein DotH n=1 Tax=Gluconobacter albidus TaxID=318683 RepID=A0A149TM52_9PROT|nr:DotH/IcmK family type IV secretion protein [Gluconobacter albidus]KXV49950.1 type IV secretion protein DotH [Gluconobacter albidus]